MTRSLFVDAIVLAFDFRGPPFAFSTTISPRNATIADATAIVPCAAAHRVSRSIRRPLIDASDSSSDFTSRTK
jgi:hypothetical protein